MLDFTNIRGTGRTRLGSGKRIPFDSGKELQVTKKVWVEIGFAKCESNAGKFEWKIVGGAALGGPLEGKGVESGPFSGRGSSSGIHLRSWFGGVDTSDCFPRPDQV